MHKKIVETKVFNEKINMEGLSFDNILGEHDIETLFMDDPEEPTAEEQQKEVLDKESTPDSKDKNKNSETNKTTEVVDPDALFVEETPKEEPETEQPESVGSDTKKQEKGDAATDEGSDTSPQNFYSSIANALAVDGILPNSDEDAVNKVNDAESFSALIEAEVNARFDEKQQRLIKALEDGVQPDDIRMYERTLNYLNSIKDDTIEEEGEKGEQLRRQVIFQDYCNKGYSKERAEKMTERSFDGGNDIEDAKEALQSNKDFFQGKYDAMLKEAEQRAEEEKAAIKKNSEALRESLMGDKNVAGNLEVTEEMRKKAFDLITRPVYKVQDTGEYLTAVQKYEAEHPVEFRKYVGLFMALTNGFKDFDSFIAPTINKEKKKGLKELEKTLNTTRTSNGSLNMVTSVKDDPDSYYSGEIRLAL